ncbi:MAG: hypothetical protein ABII71_03775 [Candidatus Micrarchaeota archaeon]
MSAPKSYLLLMSAGISAAMLFVLFFTVQSGAIGEPAPLSSGSFFQPFSSYAILIIALVALIDMLYYLVGILPMASRTPKLHKIAIIFPAVIGVLGFIIGFMSANFWVALPFFALSLANMLYGYSRISENSG